ISQRLQPVPPQLVQFCSFWRRIAYHDKVFWSTIPLDHHERAKFALRQSRPSLITIR
ncbi:hypothetical protein BV25DRAFT_1832410, partial [Artomyces pyxidatus]